jgi:sigma-E factor negative regulatory protein RseB
MKSKLFFLLAVLSAAQPLMAEPMPQDELGWLKVMAFAAHRTDYSGTFIYQTGNHVETSRITHVTDAAGEHERLEGLDGERREIIRNNDHVWCYQGNRKVLIKRREGGGTFPALLPEQLSSLNENYLIKRGEEDRVAGFHAHTLIFQPRDNLRYTHKMWAHSDSGLLLKAAVLDEPGQVIEQYAFTQLTIGGNIDRKWIVSEKSSQPQAADAKNDVAGVAVKSGWQVGGLPAGFRKILEMRRTLREGKAPVTQLVFSDGLAGISVFIESMDNKPEVRPGMYSQGVIQIYSKIVDKNLITVVGEVPSRTLLQVAESVRFSGGGHD